MFLLPSQRTATFVYSDMFHVFAEALFLWQFFHVLIISNLRSPPPLPYQRNLENVDMYVCVSIYGCVIVYGGVFVYVCLFVVNVVGNDV